MGAAWILILLLPSAETCVSGCDTETSILLGHQHMGNKGNVRQQVLLLLAFLFLMGLDGALANMQMNNPTIAANGFVRGTSGELLFVTVGEPVVGFSKSGDTTLVAGFPATIPDSSPPNADGAIFRDGFESGL